MGKYKKGQTQTTENNSTNIIM